MRKSILGICLLVCCFVYSVTICRGQGTGYIKLEGKQFKDGNGNNFFPMVMNYSAILACDNASNPSGFKAIRDYQIGTTECLLDPITRYNWNNCDMSIEDDFEKIKEMGFNAVRFILCPTHVNTMSSPGGFTMKAVEFRMDVANNGNDNAMCKSPRFDLTLGPTDYSTQNAQTYFNIISHILDLASAHDIKIILLCSNGSGDAFPDRGSNLAESNDYAAYLSALATALKDKPALLAYDLFNEPTYQAFNSAKKMDIPKETICQYVGTWYDAIKAADPHHLVTLGCIDIVDVFYWDPGVMKIDFVSMHPYPFPEKNFLPANSSITRERILNGMAWFTHALQKPWILGETGLNTNNVPCLQPYMWGNNNDQKTYLTEVLNASRDCGSSGFSWWTFQDAHAYCIPPDFCNPTCSYCNDWAGTCGHNSDGSVNQEFMDALKEKVQFNYGGLLEYSDPDNSGHYNSAFDKPAVAVMQAFDPNAGAACVAPTANYYNPHQYPSSSHTINGFVRDINGIPIKDAVIYSRTTITPPSPDPPFMRLEYTFTDANGIFQMIPAPDQDAPTSIDDVHIAGYGTEKIYRKPALNNKFYFLKRTVMDYDLSITNTTLNIFDVRQYQAFNSITASDVSIHLGAISDFTARGEIHLLSDFEAKQGSEVHIYSSEPFSDCADYSGYLAEWPSNNNSRAADNPPVPEIELTFRKKYVPNSVSIFPNPAHDKVTITLNSNDKNEVIRSIFIYDYLGRKSTTINPNSNTFVLDLSEQPKGVYFFLINDSVSQFKQKIIIQ